MRIELVDGVPKEYAPKFLETKSRHDFTVQGEVLIQPIVEGIYASSRTVVDEDILLEKSNISKIVFTSIGSAVVDVNSI